MRRHFFVIAIGFAACTLANATPPNDECTGAIVVPSVPFTSAPVDLTDATPQEVNEGLHTCASAGGDRTVWYSFTPAVSTRYVITTCSALGATGSTVYDTIISVFESSGGACPQAAQVACDDSATCAASLPGGPYVDQGTIIASLSAGTTYFIVAGHWTDDFGGVAPGFESSVVHIEQMVAVPNDTCDNPTPLTLNRVTQGSTLDAANDYGSQGDAACFSGIGQSPTTSAGLDVVFSFLAPASGKYSFHYVQDDSGASLRSQNPALYLSHDCPAPAPLGPAVSCIKGANRIAANGAANGNRSEEINCVPLAAGEQVYFYFDDRAAGNLGGPFAVEVTKCVEETEPNDTIATANLYPGCALEGAAQLTTDVDFFDLGAPPAGSKVFLGIDAAAANDGDFELRLTNATDTLGYDDNDGSSWISMNAPIVAGPFADGSELYARVNKGSIAAQLGASEPYRLYARVETGFAQQEVDSPSNASYYYGNHVTGGGFVRGVMATIDDQDCFRFVAHEGDNLVVFSDNNPSRLGGTITNVWPILRDVVLGPPMGSLFTGQVVRNNVAPSPGTLTGTSPSVTSNFVNYRARYTGTYMACFAPTPDVNRQENPPAAAYPLPYQGSISLNCGPIPAPASRVTDVGVTKTGPAGPVNTGEIIEYTITLTNQGTDIAEDVRLTDALPPELVFVGLNVDDGFNGNSVACVALPSPGANDDIVDCTAFSIAPGASTVFTLRVQVANCIGAGIEVTNTASITTLSTDPNVVNDSDSWTFTTTETGSCNDLVCDASVCVADHCTVNDHCEAGACTSAPVDCDDNNLCSEDSCDPYDDDGDPCIHDFNSIYNSCYTDGNDCTFDMCDPILFCIFPPVPAGFACSDVFGCTTNDSCDGNGACIGVSPCDDGLPCTYDVADENNSCACSNPRSFPGTNCNDGNPCTDNTSCDGFGDTVDHCTGGSFTDCNDSNPCTDDSCDSASGCVHSNNTDSCSDGNACTTGDTCGGGTCHGGAPLSCNDGNGCTADSCDPPSGCVYTNNTAPCSDGNACTAGDTCGGGACGTGVLIGCVASDQCHLAGTCDPASGLCSNPARPDGSACDDGDSETSNDACQAGTCVGTPACHSTDDPKTRGFYTSLCPGGHGHSGDTLTDDDAVCVASITSVFGAIQTASEICAVLASGNQGGGDEGNSNDHCERAEDELMALALNICKQRVCPSQGIDSECGTNAGTVGESLVGIDAILSNPERASSQCRDARCQAKEINNGHALELDSLTLTRENNAVRLSWFAPILDDGTGAPAGYKVWRRPMRSLVSFTQIGTTTGTTFLDASAESSAWEYNLTPITP